MFHLGFLQNHQAVAVSLKRFKTWASKKSIKPANLPNYFFLKKKSSEKLTFQTWTKLCLHKKRGKSFHSKFSRHRGAHIHSSLSQELSPSWLSPVLTQPFKILYFNWSWCFKEIFNLQKAFTPTMTTTTRSICAPIR